MALTVPTIIAELRDTVLTAELGTYVHHSDATLNVPAIGVGTRAPEGYRPTGLEVILYSTPEDEPSPLLGDGIRVSRRWVVTLKMWDRDGTVRPAIEKLMTRYRQMRQPVIVPATDETIEQATARIPEELHMEAT